jgi:transcriptional regulator GlxA family with amidase domain
MNEKLRGTIDLMNSNLNRKLSLAELAKSVDLSVSRFSHLFRNEVGESPVRYLIMLRMEKACLLLSDPAQSVKIAMAEVGFHDKGNFARAFKKAYGETPSAYRARQIGSALVPGGGKTG